MKDELVFTRDDRPTLLAGYELLDGAIEKASKASERIGVDTQPIDKLEGRNKLFGEVLERNIDRDSFAMPSGAIDAVRIGMRLELDKLDQICKGQMSLAIDPSDTNDRVLHVQRLLDRIAGHLTGQLEAV